MDFRAGGGSFQTRSEELSLHDGRSLRSNGAQPRPTRQRSNTHRHVRLTVRPALLIAEAEQTRTRKIKPYGTAAEEGRKRGESRDEVWTKSRGSPAKFWRKPKERPKEESRLSDSDSESDSNSDSDPDSNCDPKEVARFPGPSWEGRRRRSSSRFRRSSFAGRAAPAAAASQPRQRMDTRRFSGLSTAEPRRKGEGEEGRQKETGEGIGKGEGVEKGRSRKEAEEGTDSEGSHPDDDLQDARESQDEADATSDAGGSDAISRRRRTQASDRPGPCSRDGIPQVPRVPRAKRSTYRKRQGPRGEEKQSLGGKERPQEKDHDCNETAAVSDEEGSVDAVQSAQSASSLWDEAEGSDVEPEGQDPSQKSSGPGRSTHTSATSLVADRADRSSPESDVISGSLSGQASVEADAGSPRAHPECSTSVQGQCLPAVESSGAMSAGGQVDLWLLRSAAGVTPSAHGSCSTGSNVGGRVPASQRALALDSEAGSSAGAWGAPKLCGLRGGFATLPDQLAELAGVDPLLAPALASLETARPRRDSFVATGFGLGLASPTSGRRPDDLLHFRGGEGCSAGRLLKSSGLQRQLELGDRSIWARRRGEGSRFLQGPRSGDKCGTQTREGEFRVPKRRRTDSMVIGEDLVVDGCRAGADAEVPFGAEVAGLSVTAEDQSLRPPAGLEGELRPWLGDFSPCEPAAEAACVLTASPAQSVCGPISPRPLFHGPTQPWARAGLSCVVETAEEAGGGVGPIDMDECQADESEDQELQDCQELQGCQAPGVSDRSQRLPGFVHEELCLSPDVAGAQEEAAPEASPEVPKGNRAEAEAEEEQVTGGNRGRRKRAAPRRPEGVAVAVSADKLIHWGCTRSRHKTPFKRAMLEEGKGVAGCLEQNTLLPDGGSCSRTGFAFGVNYFPKVPLFPPELQRKPRVRQEGGGLSSELGRHGKLLDQAGEAAPGATGQHLGEGLTAAPDVDLEILHGPGEPDARSTVSRHQPASSTVRDGREGSPGMIQGELMSPHQQQVLPHEASTAQVDPPLLLPHQVNTTQEGPSQVEGGGAEDLGPSGVATGAQGASVGKGEPVGLNVEKEQPIALFDLNALPEEWEEGSAGSLTPCQPEGPKACNLVFRQETGEELALAAWQQTSHPCARGAGAEGPLPLQKEREVMEGVAVGLQEMSPEETAEMEQLTVLKGTVQPERAIMEKTVAAEHETVVKEAEAARQEMLLARREILTEETDAFRRKAVTEEPLVCQQGTAAGEAMAPQHEEPLEAEGPGRGSQEMLTEEHLATPEETATWGAEVTKGEAGEEAPGASGQDEGMVEGLAAQRSGNWDETEELEKAAAPPEEPVELQPEAVFKESVKEKQEATAGPVAPQLETVTGATFPAQALVIQQETMTGGEGLAKALGELEGSAERPIALQEVLGFQVDAGDEKVKGPCEALEQPHLKGAVLSEGMLALGRESPFGSPIPCQVENMEGPDVVVGALPQHQPLEQQHAVLALAACQAKAQRETQVEPKVEGFRVADSPAELASSPGSPAPPQEACGCSGSSAGLQNQTQAPGQRQMSLTSELALKLGAVVLKDKSCSHVEAGTLVSHKRTKAMLKARMLQRVREALERGDGEQRNMDQGDRMGQVDVLSPRNMVSGPRNGQEGAQYPALLPQETQVPFGDAVQLKEMVQRQGSRIQERAVVDEGRGAVQEKEAQAQEGAFVTPRGTEGKEEKVKAEQGSEQQMRENVDRGLVSSTAAGTESEQVHRQGRRKHSLEGAKLRRPWSVEVSKDQGVYLRTRGGEAREQDLLRAQAVDEKRVLGIAQDVGALPKTRGGLRRKAEKEEVFRDAKVLAVAESRSVAASAKAKVVKEDLMADIPPAGRIVGRERPEYTHTTRNIYVMRRPKLESLEDNFCPCRSRKRRCDEQCLCRAQYMSCWEDCGCAEGCGNRPFEREKRLHIVKTKRCGWGAFAAEEIEEGQLVVEYAGEVINDSMCEKRLWQHKKAGNMEWYMCEVSKDFVIDATTTGGFGRFVNHSCEPNAKLEKWRVGPEMRVGIFALRKIKVGEEVSYDYNFVTFGTGQQCMCGSPKCRGTINVNTGPLSQSMTQTAAGAGQISQGQHGGQKSMETAPTKKLEKKQHLKATGSRMLTTCKAEVGLIPKAEKGPTASPSVKKDSALQLKKGVQHGAEKGLKAALLKKKASGPKQKLSKVAPSRKVMAALKKALGRPRKDSLCKVKQVAAKRHRR